MGSTLSRLNDDFVELSDADYRRSVDHLILMDVSDILEQMHATILAYGEKPAYENLQYGSIGAFLFDLYHEVGYLPNGNRGVTQNIRDVLDTAPQYFDCPELTPLQRQCWYVVMQQMVDRFVEFRMYDASHVHAFDFHDYRNGTLYLKLP
jgi:hypothetical protein